MRLVIALALALTLGAGFGAQPTQAFVVAPQHHHRLVLPSCARGCSSVPVRQAVPLGNGDTSAWSNGGERRGYGYALSPSGRSSAASVGVSMRAGVGAGRGRRVEIEGSGGEKRRVQRRSRKPDLRSMRRIGLQAAAAAVVVQEDQGVDVETKAAEDAQHARAASLAEKYEASVGLREREMMEEEQIGTVQDKYTQIYVPVDGIVIKKTYGFWTWQVFGAVFVQHFVRNIIRKGGSLKKTSMSELNWDHIVTEPEHLLELKAYCCEECGYTLFPARGRHEHFFDEVEDFKCPECEAPRSAFYDANDKNDPHNKPPEEEEEGEEGTPGADEKGGGADDDDDNAGGVVTSAAAGGGPSSAADAKSQSPSATTTTAPAPPSPSPSPSAPASSTPGSKAAPPESKTPPDNKRPDGDGDDDGDDLLDF